MEWKTGENKDGTPNRHFQATAEGYRVCAAKVMGEWRFAAWPPKPPYNKLDWRASLHSCLSVHHTAEEARQACEEHWQRCQEGSPGRT